MTMAEILEANRPDVEKALASGATAGQVAAQFGVTRGGVIGWARRTETKLGPPSVRESHAARRENKRVAGVHRMRDEGDAVVKRYGDAFDKDRTVKILAAKYCVPMHQVRTFLRQRGVEVPKVAPSAVSGSKKFSPLPDLPAPPAREGVPFIEATRFQCHYPLWTGDAVTGDVCGQPVATKIDRDGKISLRSWCDDCMKRVFVPTKPLNLSYSASRANRQTSGVGRGTSPAVA